MDALYEEIRVTDKKNLLGLRIESSHKAYNRIVCGLVGKYSANGLNEKVQSALMELGNAVDITREEPLRIKPLVSSIDSILQQIPLKSGERKLAEDKKKKLLNAYAQRLMEGEVPYCMTPAEAIRMAEEFSR